MEPEPPIIAKNAAGGGIVFSREERERHLYIVGKSGSGKSTVLFNLAMHDIIGGEGVAVIDPHGDLADAIIDAIPPERTHEVCYFNVADKEHPVGFNPIASAMRLPPPASSPRSSTCGARAGVIALSTSYSTASPLSLRARGPPSSISRASTPMRIFAPAS